MSAEQVQELLNQASTALQQGQYDQALQMADQCLALDPSNGNAYLVRAIALSRTGQGDLATAAFRTAIDVMPQSAAAHYNLAVHQHSLNQKRESMESARRALEVDPNHAAARELFNGLQQELAPEPPRSDVYAPPPTAGNPYMNPPSQGDYYRPGHQGGPQGGGVSYVRNMGDGWNTFGLILVLAGAAIWVFAIINIFVKWPEIQTAMQTGQQAPTSPLEMIVNIISLINACVSIWWVASDIADRRGNWLWLVVFIICCCCTPVQAIYYFAGRNK